MNHSRKTLALGHSIIRAFSKSAPSNTEAVPARIQKLREAQQKFGVNDGVPVYLKGGLGDKVLFHITNALVFVGLGLSFQTYYRLAVK